MDKRQLAVEGFTAYEIELLITQLQRLEGRTSVSWTFCENPQSKSLDLLIVHADAAPPPAFSSSALKATTGPLVSPYHFSIEHPIRVLDLLALLQDVDCALQERAVLRSAAVSRALKAPSQLLVSLEGWYRFGELVLGRDAGYDSPWLSNQASAETIAQAVSSVSPSQLTARPTDELCVVSYEAVRWSLALRDSVDLASWQDARKAYQIQRWPCRESWHTEPWMLKLAALYARVPATLAEGVEVCGEPLSKVAKFLHAAQVCELGVTLHVRVTQSFDEDDVERGPRAGGFWEKLRRRLT